MRSFLRTSWLPTVLFLGASLVLVREYLRCSQVLAFGPVLTALVAVPVAWHWYVVESGRPGLRRAALAGASSAYLIATLSFVAVRVQFSLTHSWSRLELGALAVGFEDLFVIGRGLLIGAPIGALLGMLIAHVQRSQWDESPSLSKGTSETWRSALTAIMAAILLSPVLAAAAMVSSGELLVPLASKYSIGLSTALVATWVVTIPLAAVLGARRAMTALISRRLWVPAMVLLAPAMVIGSTHGGRWAVCSGVTSVVLVPLIWTEVVSRDRRAVTQRGAAAGASIAFLAQIVPAAIATLWFVVLRTAAPTSAGGQGGLTSPLATFFWLTATFSAVIGAGLGAVLARTLTRVDAFPISARESGWGPCA